MSYRPASLRSRLRSNALLLAGVLAVAGFTLFARSRPEGDARAVGAAAPLVAETAPRALAVAPDAARSTPPPTSIATAREPNPGPGIGPARLDRPVTDLDPETRARLEARLERERAGEARFQAGIERSQVRARDIDARVKELFQRVELEPDLLDGGLMRGLRIRVLEGGSVLEQAGFRAGDLLVRVGDRPLDDPAELPELLASAGPELSLCAERGARSFCRELSLR